jgi:hypothetical protein
LAVALQLVSNVLCNTSIWAFSLAGDASTHQGTPLLDQCIRGCFNGVLMVLHLVLVPFFQRHTAVNYVTMIKTVMNVLCPTWNDKLISIASDGENTMTGRTGGVVTLLERQCTNPVLRVWCVPHQLDLVVKTATVGVDMASSTRRLMRSRCVCERSTISSWQWMAPNAQRHDAMGCVR